MTIKIKLVLNGIEIIDFDTLPDNIKDTISKIANYHKYVLSNNIIHTLWDEENVDIIYMLNKYFDLFIMKNGGI